MNHRTPLIFADATRTRSQGQPWFTFKNLDGSGSVEILIYDQIGKDWWTNEGVGAKEFAAQLKEIPKGRAITVCLNSPGGNVHDGMAIYNLLRERKEDVTCRIDGVAASIASVIALAGKELRMPRNALLMIHDPYGICTGDADEMRRMADGLDRHKDAIVAVYHAKTGKPKSEISEKMSAETWMAGEDAKAFGFADTLTEDITIQAQFDLSRFRRVPESAQNKPSSPAQNGGATPTAPMTRSQILALLRRHGIQVSDTATNAEILNLLGQLPPAEQAARAQAEAFLNAQPPSAPAGTTVPPATTPPPAPAPQASVDPAVAGIRAELDRVNAQLDRERRDRVTRVIDQCVVDDRIPQAQRDAWITDALRDESVLARLQALPSRPPGSAPLNVDIQANASIQDIVVGFERHNEPMNAFMRGSHISARDISNSSVAKASFFRAHATRLRQFMNTNTVPTGLKRQVILQEVIVDFARRLLPLRAFSTVFSNIPLQGTNKVNVPFFDLDATASTAWNAGTGYAAGDTATDTREITVGTGAADGGRLYQGLSFTSEELARQPYLNIVQLARLKAEKLAYDLFVDVLGVVTAANYGTAALNMPASAFDSDDLADLKYACRTWPEMGRSLIIDSAYDANLLKDPSIKSALHFGGPEAIREGRVPRIMGFDYYELPTIPSNSENLTGMAVFQSAILVATAPVPPSEEVRNAGTQYEVVTDPQTGITFEYRRFGDNTLDTGKHFIEVNYGFAKGNANALKRITSA